MLGSAVKFQGRSIGKTHIFFFGLNNKYMQRLGPLSQVTKTFNKWNNILLKLNCPCTQRTQFRDVTHSILKESSPVFGRRRRRNCTSLWNNNIITILLILPKCYNFGEVCYVLTNLQFISQYHIQSKFQKNIFSSFSFKQMFHPFYLCISFSLSFSNN